VSGARAEQLDKKGHRSMPEAATGRVRDPVRLGDRGAVGLGGPGWHGQFTEPLAVVGNRADLSLSKSKHSSCRCQEWLLLPLPRAPAIRTFASSRKRVFADHTAAVGSDRAKVG